MTMALPAQNYMSNNGRTEGEMKVALEDQRDAVAASPGGAASVELTIAAGVVTPPVTAGDFRIDTEADAATDDLTNALQTNSWESRRVRFRCENAARATTVKHAAGGSGQFLTVDGLDFVLNATDRWIDFEDVGNDWVERARSYGADFPAVHDHLRIAAVPAHNTLCPHTRLRLDYATAATVSVAADAVVLADASGRLKRFNSLSETLNIANTGANGRDVTENGGAEQASVWYHVWAIGKSDGTLDVFASQACYPGGSSIYSVLPSGYTWAGYIGAVYNDGGSNLREFKQRGGVVSSWAGTGVVNAGTAATYTAVSLAGFVPITAAEVDIDIRAVATGAVTSVTAVAAAEGSGTVSDFGFVVAGAGGASSANMIGRSWGRLMMTTAQQLKYFVSAGASCTINVVGWVY